VIEPLLRWRKSSLSTTDGDCVEVAWPGPVVGVRDSKNRAGGHLSVPPAAFGAFVASLRAHTEIGK
jgi:hypothetical protein